MSALFKKMLVEKERLLMRLEMERETTRRIYERDNGQIEHYQERYEEEKSKTKKYKFFFEILIGEDVEKYRLLERLYQEKCDAEQARDAYSRSQYPDMTGK